MLKEIVREVSKMEANEKSVRIRYNGQEITIPLGGISLYIDFIGFEKDFTLSANSKQYFEFMYNEIRFGGEKVLFMER